MSDELDVVALDSDVSVCVLVFMTFGSAIAEDEVVDDDVSDWEVSNPVVSVLEVSVLEVPVSLTEELEKLESNVVELELISSVPVVAEEDVTEVAESARAESEEDVELDVSVTEASEDVVSVMMLERKERLKILDEVWINKPVADSEELVVSDELEAVDDSDEVVPADEDSDVVDDDSGSRDVVDSGELVESVDVNCASVV